MTTIDKTELPTELLDVDELTLDDLCDVDTPIFNQLVDEFFKRNELPEEIVAGFQSAI